MLVPHIKYNLVSIVAPPFPLVDLKLELLFPCSLGRKIQKNFDQHCNQVKRVTSVQFVLTVYLRFNLRILSRLITHRKPDQNETETKLPRRHTDIG